MRLFTPEEANAALPEVRPLVERLVEERRALVALGEELEAVQALIGGNGGSLDPSRVGELQEWRAQDDVAFAFLDDLEHRSRDRRGDLPLRARLATAIAGERRARLLEFVSRGFFGEARRLDRALGGAQRELGLLAGGGGNEPFLEQLRLPVEVGL